MTDITQTHREYKKNYARWEQIHDCIEGEDVVKYKAEKYLPYPVALGDVDKSSAEYKEKYGLYLEGAHFVEFTAEAVDDLTASAFRAAPTIEPEPPADLEYFQWDDVLKTMVHTTVSYGNSFVLVDYPTVEDATAETDKSNLAFAQLYEPLDVINWTVSKRSGDQKLTRVVLREIDEDSDMDTYQYRELYIEDGVYKQRIYKDDLGLVPSDEIIPMASGSSLDFIPGTFIGATSNTANIDKSPVIGISNSNVKHYQTWAELIWTQTYTGHPQLVLTGLANGWNKEAEKADVKIKLDASQVLALEGDTASANLLEISGSNLVHFQTLEKLEVSMAEQGARLKASSIKSGVESAETLLIRHSGDISKLGSIAENAEAALTLVFEWLGMFMGTTYSPVIQINRNFFTPIVDGAFLSALVSAESARVIPAGSSIDYLKESEILETDEETEVLLSKIQEQDSLLPPTGEFDGTIN